MSRAGDRPRVDPIELEVGPVGHLGVCVGHADDGRTVLVRHALPGERVRAVVTEARTSYLRADAVEILRPSAHRVPPPCPWAGPGRCGGCDWQHVALPEQRRLKALVVAEQLTRLGGVDPALVADLVVEPVASSGPDDGLGWRTRLRFAVDRRGRAGLRRHRSHSIEPIGDCLIAHPALEVPSVVGRRWPPRVELEAALTRTPSGFARVGPEDATVQVAVGREWRVPPGGFWQVHPGAADALVSAVRAMLSPVAGERLVDLYAGVGLFAGALVSADRLAAAVAVESDPDACRAARHNLADLPVDVVTAATEDWVVGGAGVMGETGSGESNLAAARPELIVLDPPRRGAGPGVVAAITATSARGVAYVACDPSALGRDTAHFRSHGWVLRQVRAFDAFPMTAHVETIGLFQPRDADPANGSA